MSCSCRCCRLLHAVASFAAPPRPTPHPLPAACTAARCIDSYIEARVKEAEGAADAAAPDPRLVAVVERLFERCYAVR